MVKPADPGMEAGVDRRIGALRVTNVAQRARNIEPTSVRYSPRSDDEQRVFDALGKVVDPCSIATGAPLNLSDMGLLREIIVAGGVATVKLRLTNPFCFQIGLISQEIEKKVAALDLYCDIEVDPVDPWSTDLMTPDARERLRRQRAP
jgi:metal-sulfur cluster biosynthetic enzyme